MATAPMHAQMAATPDLHVPLQLPDVPVPTLIIAGGCVVAANPACGTLLGGDPTGRPLADVMDQGLPPADVAAWRTEVRTVAGVPLTVDVRATHRGDGSAVVVLQAVAATQLLSESVGHLDAAFETAPIGMAFFDTDGRYLRVNRALCELLGRSAGELLGRRDAELTHPDDRASDVDASWRILRGEIDTWQTEKRFVRPDGSVTWVIANLSFLRDAERRPLTWLGQFQDITARKALEDRLRELADEDPLTGLANRRRLDTALREALALAGRHGHGGAVVYVDLDGFKVINDSYGHEAGDALLRGAAAAMRARCRVTDTVARVGGDEFAVLLPIATPEQAQAFHAGLQRVLDEVTIDHHGVRVPLTATLGTAWFGPDTHLGPDDVLAEADRAMYAARSAETR